MIDHYSIMDNFKKNQEKNKNRLRTIYPKTQENFKNSKPWVQFYLFLELKTISSIKKFLCFKNLVNNLILALNK